MTQKTRLDTNEATLFARPTPETARGLYWKVEAMVRPAHERHTSKLFVIARTRSQPLDSDRGWSPKPGSRTFSMH